MQTFSRWFNQDLNKPIMIQYGGLAFMGDDGTPEVGVHVTVGGEAATLGGSAGATVIRPDGSTVPVTGGVVSGSDVSVKLSEACFSIPGRIAMALTITDGTTTMTVLKAVFVVDTTATDDLVDPSGDVALDVAALVAAINEATASVPSSYDDLLAAVAPNFSDAAPWTAGQHVWYDGQLYMFIADHPAGTWIGTDAEQMPIFTGVERLAAQVDLISDQTANIWYDGDVTLGDAETFTQFLLKNPLPAGTYTISLVATGGATPANSRIMFSRLKTPGALPSSSFIATVNLAHDGERHSATFTLSETAYCVRFMGGTATSGSNSLTGVAFADIQIEAGSDATAYIEPMTAVDHEARAGVANLVSEQAGNMRFKRYLAAGEDLDDFVNAFGMYVWIANNAPLNRPEDLTGAGVLLCFGADLPAFPLQVVVANSTNNDAWYRYYRNGAWSPWRMLATYPHIEVGAYITPDIYTTVSGGHAPVINAALNDHGFCRLGPGEYIIKEPIIMPEGSMLLGCGPKTVLRLSSSAAEISVIRMAAHCTVRDVTLVGLSSGVLTPSDTIGGRVGIAWDGITATPTPSSETDPRKMEYNAQGVISGVSISDFDGAGILLRDSGVPVDKGVMISDCFIHRNTVGIYIQRNSEFNKISNSTITWNRWGVLNRGGNNLIDGCGIDKNYVGIQIDDDEGSNGGHGGVCNCTINHSGANNDGYGLIVRGTGRMLISNCNVFYSGMLFQSTDGNIVTGCGFGNAANVEITGGRCTVINGCIFYNTSSTITIMDNTTAKVVNCFTRAGWDATVVNNTTATLSATQGEEE